MTFSQVIVFCLVFLIGGCHKKKSGDREELVEENLEEKKEGTPSPDHDTPPFADPAHTIFKQFTAQSPYEQMYHPGTLLDVGITIAEEDWNSLRQQIPENPCGPDLMNNDHGYSYFKGDVVVQGKALSNIGIRKRNHCGSQSTVKPGLSIKFDKYKKNTSIDGLTGLTLNNSVQDPSLIRQCFAYFVAQKLGLPYPLCNFAKLSVNGVSQGIYINLEPIKKEYILRNFGFSGQPIFEGGSGGADFTKDGMKRIESKNDEANLKDIEKIIEELDGGQKDMSLYFDRESFLKFMALEMILMHWDGYSHGLNNYYFVRSPQDGKYRFVLYGTDQILQKNLTWLKLTDHQRGLLSKKVIQNNEHKDQLKKYLKEYLETLRQPIFRLYVVEAQKHLSPHLKSDEQNAAKDAANDLLWTLEFAAERLKDLESL